MILGSYQSSSGESIDWIFDTTVPKVIKSLTKVVKTGKLQSISLSEYVSLDPKFQNRTGASVRISSSSKNETIKNHFKNIDDYMRSKKFTNPRSIGQWLQMYFDQNSEDLADVYSELIEFTNKYGNEDISKGRSQSERTRDYRKAFELLDKHYKKIQENDFLTAGTITGYLVSRGLDGSQNSGDGMDNSVNNVEIQEGQLNTILEGVAGCGKTYFQNSLFETDDEGKGFGFTRERSETVVFHPSTSYEDFVSGLRPRKSGGFSGKAGIFVELCNRAAADPDNSYLLFIDEINRANTAKVFGDLLMVIEESKRTPANKLSEYKRAVLTRSEVENLEYATVRLQTAIDELPEDIDLPEQALEYLAVPDNLYVIGTMNSTDRSVGTIDLALRRRFTWRTMEPKKKNEIDNSSDISPDVWEDEKLWKWYKDANLILNDKIGPDARLGHSYFFGRDKTPVQVSHDLMKQLAEIAYIFRIPETLITESIGPTPYHKIEYVGSGLGRRPLVKPRNDVANELVNDE